MLKLWTSADYGDVAPIAKPVLHTIKERPAATALEFSPYDLPIPETGEVHLAMGTAAIDVLKESRILPRNLSIAKLRGKVWPVDEGRGHFMVTYDPRMVQRDGQAKTDIQWDIRLACRWLTTGSLVPPMGKYRWVEDFTQLIDKIKRTADESGARCRVFEDLETVGLYPWYDHVWVVSCAFCAEIGTGDLVKFPTIDDHPTDELLKQVEWIENADEVSLGGANLKFDNIWKRVKWGLPTPKSYCFDTLLGGGLLDENRSNSLNIHAKVYTPMGGYDDSFNATHDKSHMDLALQKDDEGFLIYAGGDSDAGARARVPIVDELKSDPDLLDFYTTILHPAAKAFEKIEYQGILVDTDKLRAVGAEAETRAEAAIQDMFALTPVWVKRRRSGATGDRLKFTPAVLKDIFFGEDGWNLTPRVETEITKEPSTSVDDHLKMFSDHPDAGPFLDALKRKNKAEKINSSYVTGFLKHLRPDGRFHPTYGLYVGSQWEDDQDDLGAKTGRTSAKNPHVQTIPKRLKPGDFNWPKALRSCYPAPPGRLIGEIDYDQGELKICAMLAQEPTMLQLFRDGQDMHLKTGAEMGGLTYEEAQLLEESDPSQFKFLRYGSKAVNFGKVFAQSPRGFVRYAYKQWDLTYSLEESEEIHRVFFKTYGRLKAYHNHQIQHAKEFGYTRNPFGRVRHLPLINSKNRGAAAQAARQAVNSDIQSTLSDMGLWSIAIADEEGLIDAGLDIFLFCHDAVLFYFDDTPQGWELVARMKWIMENLPYRSLVDWEPDLKMTTSLEVGPNLAALEKHDLAA